MPSAFKRLFIMGWRVLRAPGMCGSNQPKNAYNLTFLVFWPLTSACFLWFVGIDSLPAFNTTSRVVAVGGILLGLIPLWLNRHLRRDALAAQS